MPNLKNESVIVIEFCFPAPGSSSFCNDTEVNATVPVQHGGSGSSSASFLKVTELHTTPALCSSHIEYSRCSSAVQ